MDHNLFRKHALRVIGKWGCCCVIFPLLFSGKVVAQPEQASAPLVARILSSRTAGVIWAGEAFGVRISVTGGDVATLMWAVSIRSLEDGATSDLAAGTQEARDLPIDVVDPTSSLHPGDYLLLLQASDAAGSTAAEFHFRLRDPLYVIIPLEEGNYSRRASAIYAADAAGDTILYSGEVFDPEQLVIFNRGTGRRQVVTADVRSTTGVTLSGDGARLFFNGFFADPGGAGRVGGLGFVDLSGGSQHLVAPSATSLYATDERGFGVAYQAASGDSATLQYFVYNEPSGERRQISDDAKSIDYAAACPGIAGSTPLMTADGSEVVVITRAALGVAPPGAGDECRVFVYSVESRTWRTAFAFEPEISVGQPTLSADGHWLSVAISRNTPDGGRRSFPELIDLQTGKLYDPVAEVGEFTSFDSVVTGDGSGVVISTQADLDPDVGNPDHNLELFLYDRQTGRAAQITETVGGIGSTPGGCSPYAPDVNRDGSLVILPGLQRFSVEGCQLDGPQRNEHDGFWYRFARAVRKRIGNQRVELGEIADQRVIAGGILELNLSANDPDGDPVSFFAQLRDGFDVPAGSVFTDHHDGTATFRWPTRPENTGSYVLRVAAFDEGGGEVFRDVGISVVANAIDQTSTPTPSATPNLTSTAVAAHPCPGDCDSDGRVSVDELVLGTRLALGTSPREACLAFGCRDLEEVRIDCLIQAVGAALDGCPAS